jgi:hypothetical protein
MITRRCGNGIITTPRSTLYGQQPGLDLFAGAFERHHVDAGNAWRRDEVIASRRAHDVLDSIDP